MFQPSRVKRVPYKMTLKTPIPQPILRLKPKPQMQTSAPSQTLKVHTGVITGLFEPKRDLVPRSFRESGLDTALAQQQLVNFHVIIV